MQSTELRQKDNLAVRPGGHHHVNVRLLRILERQLLADHGPQRAVLESGVKAGMEFSGFLFRNAPQGERENGAAPSHQVAGRDGDVATAADDDDASVGRELEVVAEIDVGKHFENEI